MTAAKLNSIGPVLKKTFVSAASGSAETMATIDVTSMAGRDWQNCIFRVKAVVLAYRNPPSDVVYTEIHESHGSFYRTTGNVGVDGTAAANANAGGNIPVISGTDTIFKTPGIALDATGTTIRLRGTFNKNAACLILIYVDAYEQT